jgi:hypothetical protein
MTPIYKYANDFTNDCAAFFNLGCEKLINIPAVLDKKLNVSPEYFFKARLGMYNVKIGAFNLLTTAIMISIASIIFGAPITVAATAIVVTAGLRLIIGRAIDNSGILFKDVRGQNPLQKIVNRINNLISNEADIGFGGGVAAIFFRSFTPVNVLKAVYGENRQYA